MQPLQPFRSKKEFVYETLRVQILQGELRPSARLVIDDLASQFNVSPIPVREALQQLHADGLVVIEPYVGAHVSEIHQGLILEVFGLLESVEIISSQAACLRMGDSDFAEMESLLREMDQLLDDPEGWSQKNVRLHEFICEQADMRLVQDVLHRVVVHWNRLRATYLDDVFRERIEAAQQDHWALHDVMKTRDPAQVASVIRNHNQRALDSYVAHLNSIDSRAAANSFAR